jgi:hypothetical protein
MTEENNNELPSEETVEAQEYTVSGEEPTASTTPTIQTQEVSLDELKDMLQMAFDQGRLKGYFDGQSELLTNIQADPEVDQTTKEYFNARFINVEGESE